MQEKLVSLTIKALPVRDEKDQPRFSISAVFALSAQESDTEIFLGSRTLDIEECNLNKEQLDAIEQMFSVLLPMLTTELHNNMKKETGLMKRYVGLDESCRALKSRLTSPGKNIA